MITALLAILVTAMFAIVMLGVLLSQIVPTQLQQATTRTVFAAEAGVNVVVGQIRNAAALPDGAGKIYGDKKQLPCTATGTVTSGGAELKYTATVQYFIEDPTTKDDTWRNSHDLTCTPGSGPSEDPTHALIKSSGSGLTVQSVSGDIDRTIEVVYAFQVTNTNIPGGWIKSYDTSKPNDPDRFCLEAELPVAGSYVKYVNASECTGSDPKQLWVYASDYTIKLAASTVATFGSDPLCITGTPNGSTAVRVTLETCKATTDATRWNQLWSWMGNHTWQGETAALTKSSYYLSTGVSGSIQAGSYLQVWNQKTAEEWNAFNPDSRVGAGPAGKATNQIVNYAEFGRCADVTKTTITLPQMISYPCKQDPNPSQSELAWNHKWYYNEPTDTTGSLGPQQIWVNNGSKYCLKSAGTEGGFVTFESACTASNKAFQWTRVARLDSYDASYLFVDGYGRCLDLGPSYHVGTVAEPWSTLVTNSCSAVLTQKWNAPANASSAALGGYWELN